MATTTVMRKMTMKVMATMMIMKKRQSYANNISSVTSRKILTLFESVDLWCL